MQYRMFQDVLQQQVPDYHNIKGKDLTFLLKIKCFRLLLTYFKHMNYTTWRSFNYTRYPHMSENFICSQTLFRQVKDFKVVNIEIHSDHTDILTTFNTTLI